jgi:TPR repeat protein
MAWLQGTRGFAGGGRAGVAGLGVSAILQACLVVFCVALLGLGSAGAQQQPPALFSDNADSIAVIIGNKSYRQTVPVDFAQNDAKAMRDYLTNALGFKDSNIIYLEDATLNEFNQALGTEAKPQSGRLWRLAREGRSNVFVYYSGHGVPDLQTREPFLLPQDGDPNQSESGYLLSTLYANLNLLKQKIGPDRQVILMIDACFTGETGRKGEKLLAVSAPGFAPAQPSSGKEIIKLLATSAATPANWDQNTKLGLFTSEFLMGASGLADMEGGNRDGVIQWSEMQSFLTETVERRAREQDGREQRPEIDSASLAVKPYSVATVATAVGAMRDEMEWRDAEKAGSREALESYVARCKICGFRQQAMSALIGFKQGDFAAADEDNWRRLSAESKYQEYLDGCKKLCAYRDLAVSYLELSKPAEPPKVETPKVETPKVEPPKVEPEPPQAEPAKGVLPAVELPKEPDQTARAEPTTGVVHDCDVSAGWFQDPARPKDIQGITDVGIDTETAIPACIDALATEPDNARLMFQLGRAHQRAENYQKARDLFEQASAKGYLSANIYLAYMLVSGVAGPRDIDRSRSLTMAAAAASIPDAIGQVAFLQYEGLAGFTRDPLQGLEGFKRAAELGSPDALANVALLNGRGVGVDTVDWIVVARMLKEARNKGSAFANGSLAELYVRGQGVKQSEDEARSLYLQGADAGDPGSMGQLGIYTLTGFPVLKGIKKNDVKAAEWLRRGMEAGDNTARGFLAYMFENGLGGLERSDEKAFYLHKAASDAGNADSMISLSRFYDQGRPSERSPEKAASWMYASMTSGSDFALYLASAQVYNAYSLETRQELQKLLQAGDYYVGDIDGKYGPKMDAAIRAAIEKGKSG